MKNYIERHRKVLGSIGAFVAFIIAIIYFTITPEETSNASWFQKIILAYGHSICWILLGAASILWALKSNRRLLILFAYVALAVYAIFIATLFAASM